MDLSIIQDPLSEAPIAIGKSLQRHQIPDRDIRRALLPQTELAEYANAQFLQRKAATPRQLVDISYGFVAGLFGLCLLAHTAKGICWLDLAPADASLDELTAAWKPARLLRDDDAAGAWWAKAVACNFVGLPLHLCGSDFQLEVWQALLGIRSGSYMSYGLLATALSRPGAARAVGSAVGQNGVAILVPCHRVLPAQAGIGAYRWGSATKAALLQWEAA